MRIDPKCRDQKYIFAKMKFIEESQEQEKECSHQSGKDSLGRVEV